MMRHLRHWVGRHHVGILRLGLAEILVTGAAFLATNSLGVLIEAQRARSFDTFSTDELRRLRLGMALDCTFIVGYVALGWAEFSRRGDPRSDSNNRCHAIGSAGLVFVTAAGVADAVEDFLLWRALHAHDPPDVLASMRGAGLVKWGLLFGAILLVVVERRCTRGRT